MANDVYIGFGPGGILASEYARITGDRRLQVRGTIFGRTSDYPADWPGNSFSPEEFRTLAKYMLELADDAEKDPGVDELTEDIKTFYELPDESYVNHELAEFLIHEGWHKN